jgi:hypothetical protein
VPAGFGFVTGEVFVHDPIRACSDWTGLFVRVIAGPDPAIHEATPHRQALRPFLLRVIMDARVKPAHDRI